MNPLPDAPGTPLDSAATALLTRTRSSVLNVLIAVGLTIAVSGWLLRGHEPQTRWRTSHDIREILTASWAGLGGLSYFSRRILARRVRRTDPIGRPARFYWSHVAPAMIAALVAPLGLVQGFFCDPRLEAMIPFWVVPLALGAVCYPRTRELDDVNHGCSPAGGSRE